ncbi:hypothetical protein F7725_018016 [Dissostichus mawsoni]|uniref:Uncharacterized protein n=1 Tax=Dissostichus mawsoni TaxID=36200 RepID=A0A7J5XRX8_DISMA|nr:hypothetical protein F7725_018016 [Dissostichus mawsoni]
MFSIVVPVFDENIISTVSRARFLSSRDPVDLENVILPLYPELLFSQRKEREDPEEEQDRLTELLNSTSPVLLEVTVTLETELLFSQRKERGDPEEEQDRLTELNSTGSVLLGVTVTLETGSVGKTQQIFATTS